MNGRQRILNLLNHQPMQGLSWTVLMDAVTRQDWPLPDRELDTIGFCQQLGCDIFQFGDFDLSPEWHVGFPYRIARSGTATLVTIESDGTITTTWKTPAADLVYRWRGHPLRYPVQTLADLAAFTGMWRGTHYEAQEGHAWRYQHLIERIGDAGIYAPILDPSPVQSMLQLDMGLETFYGMLQDVPGEMEALIKVMNERRQEEYALLARLTPAEALILTENTSATLISPALYARYSLPHLKAFVETAHRSGKKAILHMCGHLLQLLPLIKQTGLDGIHALTPPPIGNTPFEETIDQLGSGVTMLGILDGNVFHHPAATVDDIWRLLDQLYTPRIRQANFILIVAADGLPTPRWKFEVVSDWMVVNAMR